MDEITPKVKFAENVILLDVAFLNETVLPLRTALSQRLGRELPLLDLPDWLTCLLLDAGMRHTDNNGNNEVQVLLVHGANTRLLTCCTPSELKELDGMACRTPLGECSFSCVTPAGMTSCEELFLDLLTLTLDAKDVKRVLPVPHFMQYQERVEEALNDLLKEKSPEVCARAFAFLLKPAAQTLPCPHDFINYSLLHVLGVKAEELE